MACRSPNFVSLRTGTMRAPLRRTFESRLSVCGRCAVKATLAQVVAHFHYNSPKSFFDDIGLQRGSTGGATVRFTSGSCGWTMSPSKTWRRSPSGSSFQFSLNLTV